MRTFSHKYITYGHLSIDFGNSNWSNQDRKYSKMSLAPWQKIISRVYNNYPMKFKCIFCPRKVFGDDAKEKNLLSSPHCSWKNNLFCKISHIEAPVKCSCSAVSRFCCLVKLSCSAKFHEALSGKYYTFLEKRAVLQRFWQKSFPK